MSRRPHCLLILTYQVIDCHSSSLEVSGGKFDYFKKKKIILFEMTKRKSTTDDLSLALSSKKPKSDALLASSREKAVIPAVS